MLWYTPLVLVPVEYRCFFFKDLIDYLEVVDCGVAFSEAYLLPLLIFIKLTWNYIANYSN